MHSQSSSNFHWFPSTFSAAAPVRLVCVPNCVLFHQRLKIRFTGELLVSHGFNSVAAQGLARGNRKRVTYVETRSIRRCSFSFRDLVLGRRPGGSKTLFHWIFEQISQIENFPRLILRVRPLFRYFETSDNQSTSRRPRKSCKFRNRAIPQSFQSKIFSLDSQKFSEETWKLCSGRKSATRVSTMANCVRLQILKKLTNSKINNINYYFI